jgi:hypothetical protein
VFHGTLAGVALVVRVPQFDIPDLGNILYHYYCQIKWLLLHSFVSLFHEVHKFNTKWCHAPPPSFFHFRNYSMNVDWIWYSWCTWEVFNQRISFDRPLKLFVIRCHPAWLKVARRAWHQKRRIFNPFKHSSVPNALLSFTNYAFCPQCECMDLLWFSEKT